MDRWPCLGRTFASSSPTLIDPPWAITGAEVNRWYLGLDQGIESAQMHLYMVYQHYEADIDLITRGDGAFQCNAAGKKCEPVGGKLRRVFAPLDDFDLIYSGARIYF